MSGVRGCGCALVIGPDNFFYARTKQLAALALRHAVPAALAAAGVRPDQVIGIGTDFTACTVLPVLADGTPLCELPEYTSRPHAYVKLWRHHAAQGQADRINELARKRAEPWLPRYGGLISAEWEFAKGLQLLQEAPEVYAATETPNGELGYYIVSDGSGVAYRARTRPPSFIHFAMFPLLIEGHQISDVVAVLGSLNIIAAELDR